MTDCRIIMKCIKYFHKAPDQSLICAYSKVKLYSRKQSDNTCMYNCILHQLRRRWLLGNRLHLSEHCYMMAFDEQLKYGIVVKALQILSLSSKLLCALP
jgi:hypothetical protein